MTRVLIDWGGRGTVVVARARLDVEAGRIHLPDAIPYLVDGPTVIDLASTDPGEAWRIRCYPQDRTPFTWWVTVPQTGDVVPVTDLPRLDPATLTPDAHPPQPAWAAQLAQERAARAAAVDDVRAALAALPVVGPSHLVVDDDGVPAYEPGAAEASLTTDVDGVPAVVTLA